MSAGLIGEMLQLRNDIVPVGGAILDGSESRSRERYRLVPFPVATFDSFMTLRWNELGLTHIDRRAENRDRISSAVPRPLSIALRRGTFGRVHIRSRYLKSALLLTVFNGQALSALRVS